MSYFSKKRNWPLYLNCLTFSFVFYVAIVASILVNTCVLRLQPPQTHLLHPHWEATCTLTFCLRKALILMTHLLWVAVSWHSDFSNTFQSLFLLSKMCCRTVPVDVFSVFAMPLCAAICGVGDWARDPAVGDKTHFNHGMEQQRTKSSLRQYCDVFLAEARLWQRGLRVEGKQQQSFQLYFLNLNNLKL